MGIRLSGISVGRPDKILSTVTLRGVLSFFPYRMIGNDYGKCAVVVFVLLLRKEE